MTVTNPPPDSARKPLIASGAHGEPTREPESAYLDHAATTPMSAAALAAYVAEAQRTGNASSLHSAGRTSRRAVEEARETLAKSLGARPSEVIFTSGGTEADNLAIKGIFWGRRAQDPCRTRILVSAVEHHAVLDPAFWLAGHAGADIVLLPVDAEGRLDLDALRADLAAHATETALISVMWANNEVGTVQPIRDVVRAARPYGIPVHTDAVQAVGQAEVDFTESGVDAMTVTGHKLGGPVGVGALLAKRDLALDAVIHGGGQERGVRSGTLDAASIAAFGVAARHAVDCLPDRAARLAALRDDLVARVSAAAPSAELRGPDPASGERLPGNAHFTFPGAEGDSLLYLLDSAGVQASTGSACQAGVPQPSHVLLAMGVPEAEARGALRFTLGATSTQSDVDRLVAALPQVVARAQAAGLVSGRAMGGTA
ncbi:cysteine desulfurase [Promicromonospora sp. AC04]|uniref:cysteine desulfurase family protein n=1 Tax=Promicromonospora sp. AC04 TaxID=2135723 RepID=UPI000D39498D|nr:cysteine desulfurase family protein [Promicromonospora sp. AC04]PUB22802.1 cysteine desulfurase [Promicromonospora sp. AC04]